VFSFIKAMQNLLSELKKRKGLWFTTISIISVLGIMVSMYLLTAITSNIAKEVYENMAVSYKHTLELELEDKQREFSKLVVGLKTNDNFKNNLNDKQVIDSIIENYNKNLISSDFTSITVSFYSTINQSTQYRNSVNTAANRKTPSFGIEVISEGPFVVYLEPIIVGDNILGIVEVKESILSLKKEFERNGHSIFLFLIQEKMMSNLAVNAKYLLDFLSMSNNEKIKIGFNESNLPFLLEDDKFFTIVMPIVLEK